MHRYDGAVMVKADRLARLDHRRLELEAEYAAALIRALHTTASGKWGLFDHNGDRWSRAAVAPVVDSLNAVSQAINEVRERLAMPSYELHQEFLASRGPVGAQAVGEPEQAQVWLDRLAGEKAAKP